MTQRPKYHQSAIQAFLKCGKLYEFRYVQKLRIPPRSALTVGHTVDRAVSEHMVKKIKKVEPTLQEILAVGADTFEEHAAETIFDADEDKGALKDQALKLVELHFTKVAPTIKPKTVQEEFVIEMDGGYDLGGTIDLTDEDGFIRDTKTSLRQNAASYVVNRSFQPAMYSFAYRAIRGKDEAGFVFDVLKKPTKTIGPEYEARPGTVTAGDHNWLFDSIDQVHKAITAGVALPAPEGSWYCNAKWCGYWNICKGKGL